VVMALCSGRYTMNVHFAVSKDAWVRVPPTSISFWAIDVWCRTFATISLGLCMPIFARSISGQILSMVMWGSRGLEKVGLSVRFRPLKLDHDCWL
jgi:hypothetical protein